MNKIFLDTDVILDLLLEREPFNKNAKAIFKKIESGTLLAYTSPVILANIYYISSNIKNKKIAMQNIRKICNLLKITPVGQKTTDAVLGNNTITDFEDLLQFYSATEIGCEFLITRNKKDFPKNAKVKIIGPDEFLELLKME
jgi:predicted nucleic acid-binding protein